MSQSFREYLAERKAAWDALPWYTKAWRRLKSRYYRARGRFLAVVDAARGEYDSNY